MQWMDICQRVRTDGPTPCYVGNGCDCLTKVDLTDPEVIGLIRATVPKLIAGELAPVMPVSPGNIFVVAHQINYDASVRSYVSRRDAVKRLFRLRKREKKIDVMSKRV